MGIRFGHISDTHLIGSQKSEVMLKLEKAGGDPLAALTLALQELSSEKPDFLIITGDMCHEGTAEEYAELRELLDRYLPGVPVITSMGNHDVRDAFRKGFLGDNYGGDHPYCDTLEIGGMRIISIDTAWEKQLLGSVGDDQLDWLEEVLKAPVRAGNILICHHPVCPELSSFGMEMSPRFERIIRGGNFIAIFNGHVHRSCTGYAAGVLHITCQALAFDIEVMGNTCYYTTRGGYNFCAVDNEGEFFIDSRIVTPKGTIFHQKKF
ncbi:MAG: metallophosphoesterase [Clostridiaceae bacterium]|nr:metallophosphoesterase [Clostridiaceae bacterium]